MSLLKPTILELLCPLVKFFCWALLLVLVSFCLSSPVVANVNISGDAELTYSSFEAKEDGRKVVDMSSFTQEYSLYFDKSGHVFDQRIGHYNLELGYHWNAVDATLDSDDARLDGKDNKYSTGKILYGGDVSIAPGGLPFRFNAYSYDRTHPVFSDLFLANTIINRPLIYDIDGGEHTLTGMSLMAGIQNGSYLGQYRSLLSMLPRIFIDYREQTDRSTKGIDRYDTRFRELAFVSLNKKDNWFHYRAKEYKDFENKGEDYSEQSFILGTIDTQLRRQWINLTNWIKFSADGSFTQEETEDFEIDKDPEYYDLNLFAIADYGKTRVTSLNHYQRVRHSNGLEHEFDAPQYASGWLDPNRSWAINLEFTSQRQSLTESESIRRGAYTNEDIRYLSGRLNIGHQQPVKFLLSLESEMYQSDRGDAYGGRARFEMSNGHIPKRKTFLLGYTAAFLHSDNASQIEQGNSDTLDQVLYGSVNWQITPRNTLTVSQKFSYSTGELSGRGPSYIPSLQAPRKSSGKPSPEDFFLSETRLDLETRLQASLTNRFSLQNVSMVGIDDGYSWTGLDQYLIYSNRNIRYTMKNTFEFGDDVESPGLIITSDRNNVNNNNRGSSLQNSGDVNYMLRHESTVQYNPLRNFKSNARFTFALYSDDYDNSYQTEFFQKSEYTFYLNSGSFRKVASVYQEAEYQKNSRGSSSETYFKFLSGVGFFPSRFLELGGDITYEYFDPLGIKLLTATTAATLNFEKLVCELIYSYGLGKFDNGQFDERTEHMFEAKVKRLF